MSTRKITLLLLLSLCLGAGFGADLVKQIKLDDPATAWVIHDGKPIYYSSLMSHYNVTGDMLSPMSYYGSEMVFTLSPNAKSRLLSQLESIDKVKEGKRYSNYIILNEYNELQYRITKGSGADLKAHVAAVSDEGILALVDPTSAMISFYQNGEQLSESQLYETEGDYSLEREVRVEWQGDRCYILIERPGPDGAAPRNALFISINAEGRDQTTSVLPFTYLQGLIFRGNRFFMSGYSYNAGNGSMSPFILEVNGRGKVLWTNENFGHELALSEQGNYLAARSSHASVILFDLEKERVQEINFEKNSKAALGLSVNNNGSIALIRVASDFFVKRNTHFAEVYFPRSDQTVGIQLDPQNPEMFQVYSNGSSFYLGTKYEWVEIVK